MELRAMASAELQVSVVFELQLMAVLMASAELQAAALSYI